VHDGVADVQEGLLGCRERALVAEGGQPAVADEVEVGRVRGVGVAGEAATPTPSGT